MDWDNAKLVLGCIIAIVLLVLVLQLLTIPFNLQACAIYDKDFSTRWVLFGGCYVEVESGYWINSHDMEYWQGRLRE